jgi:aspartate carbamoyltransferase
MDLLSTNELTVERINNLFLLAERLKNFKRVSDLTVNENKILINVFFEPSTRTSLSFECAMSQLGGKTITFHKQFSSINKGESFEDTIKTLSLYGDIMVLRHPEKGMVKKATSFSNIPIINGGDGNGEHPTQALLDLYTMYKKFGNDYKNKNILFVGDISNSRTVHSLLNLINLFPNMKVYFLPYQNLGPGKDMIRKYENIISDCDDLDYQLFDVIYCTRLQKERDTMENKVDIKIDTNFVNKLKDDAIIMHPLPRNDELGMDVDKNHRAFYFKQVEFGVEIRKAIIYDILFTVRQP